MIRASDLIGCVVETESGERVGRVHDLRASVVGGGWQLDGLLVGRYGMFARMTGSGPDPMVRGNVIPWESITALEEGLIRIRDSSVRLPRAPTPARP
ncbi:MAG TPA: PRC-barrel domain-containing protein [Solirubrobacteraceae bacterium]|nr:PRC-barrel domain-containing protein [Solirubrobacteraceae bacterium]